MISRSAAAEPARRLLAGAGMLLLVLSSGGRGQEALPAPEAEEAADFARRAALAALHGPPKIFLESIDADGVLRHLVGSPVWLGLTPRQQGILRAAVRDEFAQALSPVAGASAEVAWASVDAADKGPAFVTLGLRYGAAILKTRWTVQRTPRGWTVEDIALVDPGLSLAGEVGRLLGPDPVRRRDRAREARARALPRLAGLIAIAGVVALFSRRLTGERRALLWLATVPALLFAVDGALAVRRALAEPYALVESLPPQPWRRFEKMALEAQSEGRTEAARDAWTKAVDAGAPAGPVFLQMGLAARSRGDTPTARRDFERALAADPPAPGAERELGMIALAQGLYGDAVGLLQKYLREAGPDPDTLSTLAVAETDLGHTAAAVQAIQAARSLVGESWKRAELEAQVYARSGNAAAAVAALRPLESERRLDRSQLRADPAYLSIAADPVWVGFLAEPPAAPGATPVPN